MAFVRAADSIAVVKRSIYLGYEPREAAAFAVCRGSLLRHLSESISVHALVLQQLQADCLYTRPTERISGRLFDVKSRRPDYNGAMSTEFALSRFLVPHLAGSGWALFMDGSDMLVRGDMARLFALADPSKALMCVQHDYQPSRREKMRGEIQTPYGRKAWSSLMLFNVEHPAIKWLTPERVNSLTGLELHQFAWLNDAEIGSLPAEWNFLVGETENCDDPAVVHYTNGHPGMTGYADTAFADEWRAAC